MTFRSGAVRILWAALAAGWMAAGPAAYAQDNPLDGLEPAPPPGAEETHRVRHPLERYALPVAPVGPGETGMRALLGAVDLAAYRLPAEGRSSASVLAGYRTRLAEAGFETVLDCAGEGCGGFDFRFAVPLLPAPQMLMDVGDFGQLTMRRPAGSDSPLAYVGVLVSRVLASIHIQIAAILPDPGSPEPIAPPTLPPAEPSPSPGPLPSARSAEQPAAQSSAGAATAADAPDAEPETADPLLADLLRDGRVPVAGLAFGSGGAAIAPSSEATIARIAEMLEGRPNMAVAIVGHSDNSGSLAANIEVSRRRAQAVLDALVARGIPAGRLEAHGIGWLAPLTANRTEEDRRRNRRVELVLR